MSRALDVRLLLVQSPSEQRCGVDLVHFILGVVSNQDAYDMETVSFAWEGVVLGNMPHTESTVSRSSGTQVTGSCRTPT